MTAQGTSKKIRITVAELVYLLYFLVLFGGKAFGLTDGMPVYPATLYLGLLLFLIKVMLTEHSLFEFLWMGFFLALALFVYHNTGEKGLLLYVTMMLGAKEVRTERVLKTGLVVALAGYWILSFLSVFGIIQDHMFPQTKVLIGFMMRRDLGYPGMNVAHSAFFVIVVLHLLLQPKDKSTRWSVLTIRLFLCNLFVFLYTGSFTGLIATSTLLLVNLYFQSSVRIAGRDYVWMGFLVAGMILYTFVLPFLIKGDLFWKLDEIFNNRFEYPLYFFSHEKVTLFGSRFAPTPGTDLYLDNAFLYAFLQLGIIPFSVLILLMGLLIHRTIRRDQRTLLSVIIAYCVLGMSDPLLFNLGYKNILFLFIGAMLFQQSGQVEGHLPEMLRRKRRLLSAGDRQISLPEDRTGETAVRVWYGYRKRILVLAALIAAGVLMLTLIFGSATTQEIFRDMALMEEIRYDKNLHELADNPTIGWYLVYLRNALVCGFYAASIAVAVLACYTTNVLKRNHTQQ